MSDEVYIVCHPLMEEATRVLHPDLRVETDPEMDVSLTRWMGLSRSPDPLTLPGTPPPTLEALWESLSPVQRDALLPHLLGDTSADWLAGTFRLVGLTCSASTIRTYRRSLAQ